ncbi:MAG TPA: hypothetical protein VFI37_16955, partial [Gaiellaceae bacterium]|nr:hypothetical protein [Gaiellaceae bacterium]
MTAGAGPRTGRPAPAWLVAGYFTAALAFWVAATVVLALAAPELAAGSVVSRQVLLAVHLVGLGFLPLAVTGGALHVLPTLLRNDASPRRGRAALPFLCAGPALAVGIAQDLDALIWPAAIAETLGFALVAWELCAYAVRAPSGRMLLASRSGVVLSTLNAAAALVVGGALAAREWRPLWGIPHERAIAIHLHLAVIGWLTLLLVAVGRTLGPMLAMAPAAPKRRWPVEELALAGGLWAGLAGLALGLRPLTLAGAVLVLLAVARFAALIARVARQHRLDVPEGPLVHFGAGLFFFAQAAVLAIGMLTGLDVTPRRLVGYVVALLVGWAAGATLGHLGKLLSLSAWTWWPPGPRPKQAELYPARLWLVEAVLFAVGVELVVDATLAGSTALVALGGALLVVSAV